MTEPPMFLPRLLVVLSAALVIARAATVVSPFKIHLSEGISRLHQLLNSSRLPGPSQYPGDGDGIDLGYLTHLRDMWLTKSEYNWETEEALLNTFHHYTTTIENLKIHFVHEQSKDQGAIPLLLLHGWPGSFAELLPTVRSLTKLSKTIKGEKVSFHVVVASLPGFVFSSSTPANWTVNNTAQAFDNLMADVLGYSKYAVHGTDWGAGVAYNMYESYPERVGAAHFTYLPFVPPTRDQLVDEGIPISPVGDAGLKAAEEWATTGHGYFDVQTNKPNTIGFALYDNPLGQLAWLAEKYVLWSDPRYFNKSNVNDTSILNLVTLYYLTGSFVSAEYIYFQNSDGFRTVYIKANTTSPLLYTAVPYNSYWPREYVAKVGNLTRFTELDRGGHFLALDNTDGLVGELREIKTLVIERPIENERAYNVLTANSSHLCQLATWMSTI